MLRILRQQLASSARAQAPATLMANVCTSVDVADRYLTWRFPAWPGLSLRTIAMAFPRYSELIQRGVRAAIREQFGRGVHIADDAPAMLARELERDSVARAVRRCALIFVVSPT